MSDIDSCPPLPTVGSLVWGSELNACLAWLEEHVEALEASGGTPGPQGPPGPAGAPGAPGPAGPAGTVPPELQADVDANTESNASQDVAIDNLNQAIPNLTAQLAALDYRVQLNSRDIDTLFGQVQNLDQRVTALENKP